MRLSLTILKRTLLTASLLALPIGALAETRHVADEAGCDTAGDLQYCTITDAIAAADDEDTIQIAAGTYQEALSISKDLELVGAGAGVTFLDGDDSFKPVTINDNAVVQLNGLTVQNGYANWGGGISVASDGSLTIVDCVIQGNTTPGGTGGGAIATWGTLNIIESRLTGNTASGGGGAVLVEAGAVSIANSTVSDNTALGHGGALYKLVGGAATFTSATVAHNASTGTNVGGIYSNVGIVTLQNTLVAGNTNGGGASDCGGGAGASMASSGHNFIGTTSNCTVTPLPGTGDILDQGLAAAYLDDLADNGGPTFTRALLTGSVAIDAGAGCTGEDQRGVARPIDGNDNGTATCDIGAFEAAAGTNDGGTDADDGGDAGGGDDAGGDGGGGAPDLLWLTLLAAGLGARRRSPRA